MCVIFRKMSDGDEVYSKCIDKREDEVCRNDEAAKLAYMAYIAPAHEKGNSDGDIIPRDTSSLALQELSLLVGS